MATGFMSSSFSLIDLASAAAQRCQGECGPTEVCGSYDPLVSIVFAVATCEAFISELAEFAGAYTTGAEGTNLEPAVVGTFHAMYEELEASKGSLNSKYILAYGVLNGKPIDKSRNPYQDFAALVDLRNSLVHVKLDRITVVSNDTLGMKYPPIIDKLRPKGILARHPSPNTIRSWLQIVSTPALAQWCMRTAAAMIVYVIEAIPAGSMKHWTDMSYLPKFKPLTTA